MRILCIYNIGPIFGSKSLSVPLFIMGSGGGQGLGIDSFRLLSIKLPLRLCLIAEQNKKFVLDCTRDDDVVWLPGTRGMYTALSA